MTSVLQHLVIREDGPLRATVELSLKISDKSYLKQTIIVEAGCPYLKFETGGLFHYSDLKFLDFIIFL